LFSLIFSEISAGKFAKASYYLLPMRFFELLTGCILAIYMKDISPKIGKGASNLFSILGMTMILYAAITYNRSTTFPGFNAMLPVMGVSCFICAQGGYINKILSHRSFNYLGQMSYSLYLWHWPFLVALVYLEKDSEINKLIALILAFIVSWFSLNYIEAPFRNIQKSNKGKYFYPSIVLSIVLLTAFSGIGLFYNGFEQRYEEQHRFAFNTISSSTDESKCLAADRVAARGLLDRCSYEYGSGQHKVLLVGDSHANHFNEFVKSMAQSRGDMRIDEHTSESCPPIFNIKFKTEGASSSHIDACYNKNLISKKIIENGSYEYVILAASWPSNVLVFSENSVLGIEESRRLYYKAFNSSVDMIKKTGAKVIIFDKVPGTGDLEFNCPIKKIILGDDRSCIAKIKHDNEFDLILNSLDKRDSLSLFSIRDLLCKNNTCKLEVDGMPLYRDNSHLNKVASKKLSEMFEVKYGNIFSGNYL